MVFSTKNREPLLVSKEVRREVFRHIKQNAEQKEIRLDCINGYHDHAHCLISLNKEQNISKTSQLIKGESSFWINKNNVIKDNFSWQDDYWAVSVSESHVQSVREYIKNQEELHKKVSITDEVNEFTDVEMNKKLIDGKKQMDNK